MLCTHTYTYTYTYTYTHKHMMYIDSTVMPSANPSLILQASSLCPPTLETMTSTLF